MKVLLNGYLCRALDSCFAFPHRVNVSLALTELANESQIGALGIYTCVHPWHGMGESSVKVMRSNDVL